MRRYRILKQREGHEVRYVVCAPNLEDPGIEDVINVFPGTPAGLRAAEAYIAETNARNAGLLREGD